MSTPTQNPRLYNLASRHSKSPGEIFGKNTFGVAFPLSLSLYMHNKHQNKTDDYRPVYLKRDQSASGWSSVVQDKVSVPSLLGDSAFPGDLEVEFEEVFAAFEAVTVGGRSESVDVVTFNRNTGDEVRPIEVKLTVVPDGATKERDDPSDYSCEIVTRPHQWYYVMMSVATAYDGDKQTLKSHTTPVYSSVDFTDENDVKANETQLLKTLEDVLAGKEQEQVPFMLHGIWKSMATSPDLHDDAFDLFAWSDFALGALAVERARGDAPYAHGTETALRSAAQLMAGLHHYATNGTVDWEEIYSSIDFGRQNDKAIQMNGNQTYHYCNSPELSSPRVGRDELFDIVLGNGQQLLDPERSLDATVYFTDP